MDIEGLGVLNAHMRCMFKWMLRTLKTQTWVLVRALKGQSKIKTFLKTTSLFKLYVIHITTTK